MAITQSGSYSFSCEGKYRTRKRKSEAQDLLAPFVLDFSSFRICHSRTRLMTGTAADRLISNVVRHGHGWFASVTYLYSCLKHTATSISSGSPSKLIELATNKIIQPPTKGEASTYYSPRAIVEVTKRNTDNIDMFIPTRKCSQERRGEVLLIVLLSTNDHGRYRYQWMIPVLN
jgi:hypothetical protein